MQFTKLTDDIVARNVELIVELRALDGRRRKVRLAEISLDAESTKNGSVKISAGDLRAIMDALDIEEMASDFRRPL